jgi:hypothetical protein
MIAVATTATIARAESGRRKVSRFTTAGFAPRAPTPPPGSKLALADSEFALLPAIR